MPKKVVVKQDTSSGVNKAKVSLCASKALAEALGGTYSIEGQESSGVIKIPLSSVGYPDHYMEISERTAGSNPNELRIGLFSSAHDVNLFTEGWQVVKSGSSSITYPTYNAVNACVIRDKDNDTVLIGMHIGTGDYAEISKFGEDSTYSGAFYVTFFIARDVNDGLLWGYGHDHIIGITNGQKIMILPEKTNTMQYALPEMGGPEDFIQLVKMRNYLSDGYPEMKTAYVSVTRPLTSSTSNSAVRSNLSYYSDGALWGNTGTNSTQGYYRAFYQPIDPFVKY